MKPCEELLAHIEEMRIVDTHEHLPLQWDGPKKYDVLSEFLIHYFSSDLVSAGLSDAALAEARNASNDLAARWKIVEPYWHAAESTGYGRALALAARDLFGIEPISARTILELNKRFLAARARKDYYAWVLREKSRIALSICDEPWNIENPPDGFVFAFNTDSLIMPDHFIHMRPWADEVGVQVHTLDDWKEVARRLLDKRLDGKSRGVCLKSALAYQRPLRYEKATEAEAEGDFREFFSDANLPAWRAPFKVGAAFQNHMMHHLCKLADERGLVFQFHTGIQEGNGNFLTDANPALLSNLFLEYANVKFDLFHMGYPYVMEAGTLAKNFRNVTLDMCWGHIISPEASRRALVEWLDAVPANKISAFGGDYGFAEGVYGHQYLARRNIAAALAQKVEDGTFDLSRAKEIARWVFVDNPTRIFGLQRFLAAKRGRKD